MVINYDLPWNPQRIEQRIGRSHRYGQKHDVVVVNFLNRDNEADRRVYELLDQKFKLFDGVFGASDEVLGAVESGVDFERRIAEIYQTCRHPEAIHSAFQQLQLDLAGEINDAMLNARKSLLENFDEDVQERLRVRNQDAKASLGKLERLLVRFTRAALGGHAEFDEDGTGFRLNSLPPFLSQFAGAGEMPVSRYELPRRNEEAHIYRLHHPLAQSLITYAQSQPLAPSRLRMNYERYGTQIAMVKQIKGNSGTLAVMLLSVESLGSQEEHLLLATQDSNGVVYDQELTEKLLTIPAEQEFLPAASIPAQFMVQESQPGLDFTAAHVAVSPALRQEINRQKTGILSALEQRNLVSFTQETEKLDAWADDLKVGLEREIKELDRNIKETRTKSNGAATLAEKLDMQKAQRDLEARRDRKRRELFQRQDEIQARRDGLIDELEKQLQQQILTRMLFVCEWEVV
uniref:DEAD/DEAH box helicase n=1 Tax=mine drainage metagenome TaxID=410659 RepID=E6QQ34_9ZZZZ